MNTPTASPTSNTATHQPASARTGDQNTPPAIITLAALRASGWVSKPVAIELRDNLVRALEEGAELFPGIVGYDDTVIPEVVNALLAGHDMLFLGEKGQGKSRLMRQMAAFLDEWTPYIDTSAEAQAAPLHDDPTKPITRAGRAVLERLGENTPIAWWHRSDRYAERLAPGTKFADVIGEIDPAKILSGVSMSAEDALHFGLIPRMHRGIFAMNELPDLDDLVQVGLFNILEERDVQIRGYPVRFDIDILVLFSANPTTYNRSGKVIPQLKDRIGATIQTHYPKTRDAGIDIMEREAAVELGGKYPVVVPRFMKEIVEQMAMCARKSKHVDHASGVSARFTIANYRTMIANARRRSIVLKESPAVPRISDLAHFHASSAGKLELDLMGSHQMTEKQALDAILAQAIGIVFEEYVTKHGLAEIGEVFAKGVSIEVGDLLPSAHYESIVKRVPKVWDKAFEVNASESPAVRASCCEFVLAGLWAKDAISRAERHGRMNYQV